MIFFCARRTQFHVSSSNFALPFILRIGSGKNIEQKLRKWSKWLHREKQVKMLFNWFEFLHLCTSFNVIDVAMFADRRYTRWKWRPVIHDWETNYMVLDKRKYYQYFMCELEEEWLTKRCLLELRWEGFIHLTCRVWPFMISLLLLYARSILTPDSRACLLHYCVSDCTTDEGLGRFFFGNSIYSPIVCHLLCIRFKLHLKFCNRC